MKKKNRRSFWDYKSSQSSPKVGRLLRLIAYNKPKNKRRKRSCVK